MGAISEPNHHLCIPLNGLWCPGSLGLDSGISVYFDGVFCQSTDVWVRKSSYPVNIRISVGREGDSSSLRLRLHEVEGAGRNMVLFQQPVVKEAQVHFGCKHTFADGKAAGYCTAPDNAFSDTGGTIGDVSDIASRMQREHLQQEDHVDEYGRTAICPGAGRHWFVVHSRAHLTDRDPVVVRYHA